MLLPDAEFTIGSFASAAGVNVETIRFYQRRRLLPMPARTYGRIRRYSDADVARVRFIKAAQGLGFSLDEIAELLRLDDGTHCDDAREAAEAKLHEVREKLTRLRRIEGALARLIRTCRATTGRVQCPLIDSLRSGAVRGRMAQ